MLLKQSARLLVPLYVALVASTVGANAKPSESGLNPVCRAQQSWAIQHFGQQSQLNNMLPIPISGRHR